MHVRISRENTHERVESLDKSNDALCVPCSSQLRMQVTQTSESKRESPRMKRRKSNGTRYYLVCYYCATT